MESNLTSLEARGTRWFRLTFGGAHESQLDVTAMPPSSTQAVARRLPFSSDSFLGWRKVLTFSGRARSGARRKHLGRNEQLEIPGVCRDIGQRMDGKRAFEEEVNVHARAGVEGVAGER